MRQVNSFDVPAAPTSIGRLQTPVEFPDGDMCSRIRVEATIPVKNTDDENATFTYAQALDLMVKFFGTWNLAFGDKVKEVVDNAESFNRMRELALYLTGRDMLFNGIELRNYTENVSAAFTVNAGATTSVVVEFVRPFLFDRLGTKLDEWCPGTSQMRQLKMDFVRGPAFGTSTLQQEGAASCTVIFDTVPAHENGYARVPRLYRNEQGGTDQDGPPAGGTLLGLWERTAAGASTSLGLLSLYRAGDSDLHSQITAARISRDAQLLEPDGSFDINTLVTMLYQPEQAIELQDLPTSSRFMLRQHNRDLNPMQSVWCYVPPVDQAFAEGTIAVNVTAPLGGTVKLVNANPAKGVDVPEHTASTSKVALVTPDKPAFSVLPGRIAEVGKTIAVHVPDAALPSAESDPAKLAVRVQSLAKFIPGATSPQRGVTTALKNELVERAASTVEVKKSAQRMAGLIAR